MHYLFVADGAVDVIGSTVECQLCPTISDVHAVCLDMRNVVEQQPRNRDDAQHLVGTGQLGLR